MSGMSPSGLMRPSSVSAPRAVELPTALPADRVWSESLMLTLGRWWMIAFGLSHIGYVTVGKGFAYLPYSPVFAGELLMLSGLPLVLLCRRPKDLLRLPTVWLIVLLGVWCMGRVLPFLGTYKVDALRDAAIFYYAAFTIIVAAVLIDRPVWLRVLVRQFDIWGWRLVGVVPLMFLIQLWLGERVPHWPVIDVPMIYIKMGDPLVFGAAVASISVVGLGRARSGWWYLPMALLVAVHGAVNRGGLFAFLIAFALSFAFFPRSAWPWRVAILTTVVLVALVAINPTIEVPGRARSFSMEQFTNNVLSTFMEVDQGDLQDTKSWRLDWWAGIINYTFNGDYFWGGKGFGVNLATSDGFQVFEDNSLRSPHNGSLTILARAGVPAFCVWALLHGSWLASMGWGYVKARAHGCTGWARYFVWVTAAYLATMFHGSFDVYLENPMGGIWLWTFMGLGLAGVAIAPRHPHLLDGEVSQDLIKFENRGGVGS